MTSRDFTDKLVASLTSNGKPQFEHFDGVVPGLLLRVTAAKTKTWDFTFNSPVDGRRARLKIGPYGPEPGITLKKARDIARAAQAKIADGKDPRIVDVLPGNKTIAELIEDRLNMVLRGKKRSAKRVEWRAKAYITPLIGNVAVRTFEIDPHYNLVIDPHLNRGKGRTAGMLFQDLRALMNFAVRRGAIKYSPMAQVTRPDKPTPRTRNLTPEEITAVWHALPDVLTRSDHIPTIEKLNLVTGQRLSEVAGMQESELDLTRNLPIWTIPAARSKNGFEHVVPLTGMALDLIRPALAKAKATGGYLFPNRKGTGPLTHRAVGHALANAQKPRADKPLGKFGIPHWTTHDLRRTVTTQMSRLKINHVTIGHVLNHRTVTKACVTQLVYDQNDFLDEKREALEKWAAFLTRLVKAEGERALAIAA